MLICRSFAASASDAAQPTKSAPSTLSQKPANRSALVGKATEKPEPTTKTPLRMRQGGYTGKINTPMMARKGAFQMQSMSSVNVIVEPYKWALCMHDFSHGLRGTLADPSIWQV